MQKFVKNSLRIYYLIVLRLVDLMKKVGNICGNTLFFVLRSFFLKEKKKWIGKKLWKEWEQVIKYYMGRRAFREAWREVCNEEYYYTDFVQFMNKLAGIGETNSKKD